jgi:hypothetical protein
MVVFDEERRRVDAWAKVFAIDGFEAAQEAERQEIALIRKEKDDNDLKNFKAFERMMLEGKAVKDAREQERKAKLGIEDNSSSSSSNQENVSANNTTSNPFSGETILPTKENPGLTVIREKRLADTLSGKTSQMVEDAINKKNSKESASSIEVTEEPTEEYDSKAEWTKCNIVEELDDDEDGVTMLKESNKEAPISIDLNDIDIDDNDIDNVQADSFLFDATPEQSSLSLLAALDQPVATTSAPVGTDLFELD